MSFYIFKSSVPYSRKADLVVYDRDIGHGNDKIRSDDRLLALSSRKTFEMSPNGMIKKIDEMRYSMYDRQILLTDFNFVDEDSFVDYYSQIFRYAETRKFESVEIPFVIKGEEVDKFVKLLVDLISRYLMYHELSIGIYFENDAPIQSNLQLLVDNGAYISKNIIRDIEPDEEEIRLLDLRNRSHEPKLKCGSVLKARPTLQLEDMHPNGGLNLKIHLDESFQDKLVKYLNKSNKTSVEVYTKGGISRQVFSSALNPKKKTPKKNTIICLAIGMELCLDDTLDLLNAAGYTLSHSILLDRLVIDFIEKKIYNIDKINLVLDENGEPILGWSPRE